jgi:hypothetical protein
MYSSIWREDLKGTLEKMSLHHVTLVKGKAVQRLQKSASDSYLQSWGYLWDESDADGDRTLILEFLHKQHEGSHNLSFGDRLITDKGNWHLTEVLTANGRYCRVARPHGGALEIP